MGVVTGGGDLGRRVGERRRARGLTVEGLAARAGMSPNHLRALESSRCLQPSRAGLWRLSDALDVPIDDLTGGVGDPTGGEAGYPPGRHRPPGRPSIRELTVDECTALVAPGGVGRIVFTDERGPVAWPVNFRVFEGDIIFRTATGASVLDHLVGADAAPEDLSFEVDRLDDALTEGWSVLITGHGRLVADPIERVQVESLAVEPWPGGALEVLVRLTPHTVTGRRTHGDR